MKFSDAPESNKAFTACPSILASTTELRRQLGAPAQDVIPAFAAASSECGSDEQSSSEQAEAEVGLKRLFRKKTLRNALFFRSYDTSVLVQDKNSGCAEDLRNRNSIFLAFRLSMLSGVPRHFRTKLQTERVPCG